MRAAVALAALAAVVATGCAGPPPPADTFHRLVVPASAGGGPRLEGGVEVDRPQASTALTGRALALSTGEGRTVRHARYDFWVDPPAVLVQRALAERLRAGGGAERVVLPEQRVETRWRIRGRLDRFERIPGAGGAGVVGLELSLRARGESEPRVEGVYEVVRPARADDAAGSVEALGLATGEVFDAFLSEAARALGEAP